MIDIVPPSYSALVIVVKIKPRNPRLSNHQPPGCEMSSIRMDAKRQFGSGKSRLGATKKHGSAPSLPT